MLTQEEYVHRVLELKRQGWSVTEIAAEMGYHPATVSKWLKLWRSAARPAGGPVGAGDRRAVGQAHRRPDRPAVQAAGDQRVRDRQGRGLFGLLSLGGALRAGPARSTLPTQSGPIGTAFPEK